MNSISSGKFRAKTLARSISTRHKTMANKLTRPHHTKIRQFQYHGDAPWQVWRWDFLAEVRVQEGEPLENALRRFKRKVQQEDIIKEVKRHSYYLKPGEKRRVKAALARKRNRKKARKEQD